jgi:hypothetical protein
MVYRRWHVIGLWILVDKLFFCEEYTRWIFEPMLKQNKSSQTKEKIMIHQLQKHTFKSLAENFTPFCFCF